MRDSNLDADSTFVYGQYEQAGVATQLPVTLASGTIFVATINGISGAITLAGGTSGLTFSSAGATITVVSPLTTKGDIYTRDGTNGTRLAVGADDSRLTADSSTATGLRWQTASTGWSAATGTATRTAFDTTTVTLSELAERVKGLIDDLMTQKIVKA